jgi:hypothetical protein
MPESNPLEMLKKMEIPAVTPVHPKPTRIKCLTTLLLGDTDGPATATGGLGVLTTDTETPVVSETTVSADLLEALEILTELGVDTVGEDVGVLAIDDIALSVDEPGRDLVLGGVLEDGDDSLELFGGELTSALVQIDISLLADQVRVSATDTLDLGQGVHDLLLSVNIGVEETENELEVRLLSRHERHDGQLAELDT